MMPTFVNEQSLVPPLCYQYAQVKCGSALHIEALTLVTTLPSGPPSLSTPPLPVGLGGVWRIYSEESLHLTSLLCSL
jgi:hypothetical protein